MDTSPLTIMSANQQFILALIALLVTPLVGLASLLVSRNTHKVVNSRMDEFKTLWVAGQQKAMEEFKKALQAQAVLEAQRPAVIVAAPIVPATPEVVAATAETVDAATRANDLAKKTSG